MVSNKRRYFGPELEVNPLIHFWSLSVEKQFYLFCPILLIIIIFSFSVSQFGGNLKFNYPYFEKEFDSSKVFCNIINKRCNYTLKEKPLYFDDDHLNRTGSEILIKSFLNHNSNFAK